jgi:hypothetical protein
MKHNKIYLIVAGIVLFSMVLAACAPQVSQPIATEVPEISQPIATPEESVATEPPATEEPVATEEPTEVPAAPAYEGMVYAAPNCDYGGILKSIEAVDELTSSSPCGSRSAFCQGSLLAFQIYPGVSRSTGGGGDLSTTDCTARCVRLNVEKAPSALMAIGQPPKPPQRSSDGQLKALKVD